MSDSHTLRELYEEGRRILRAAGIADADLDARILLEEACGIPLQTMLAYPEKTIPDGRVRQYRDYTARRAAHEPTAMILGKWDFCGLTFRVTKDTLIPEQDTECLVETALDLFRGKIIPYGGSGWRTEEHTAPSDKFRILDLCTGSGCILLSLLHFLPEAEGVGTDLSHPALAVARENAESLGLSERSFFLQGDMWDALEGSSQELQAYSDEETEEVRPARSGRQAGAAFDLIVSNPPYIPTDVIPTLQPEVRDGEPRLALDGGPDGLAFYRRIFAGAGRFLKPGGTIIVESGFDEAAQIQELMQAEGFTDLKIYQDYGGKDRVVAGHLAD